jgi:hypothetical protein
MARRRKNSVQLQRCLTKGMPGLEPLLGGTLANAAAVCMNVNGHVSGVKLSLSGDYREQLQLYWNGPTERIRRSYADLQEATEFGAAGVAIATLNQIEGFVVMQRSRKGTGFDYWIARKGEPSGPLFQGCTPLEVSGILNGDDAELQRRVRIKKQQITGAYSARAKVAVVEFGTPRTRIVRP